MASFDQAANQQPSKHLVVDVVKSHEAAAGTNIEASGDQKSGRPHVLAKEIG